MSVCVWLPQFLFFVNDLHASNTLCGASVLVTVLFEIPLFRYSEHVMSMFSVHALLVIAMFSYCTRVFAYTIFEEPWMVLLVEPLHGVTFACAQLASVQYCAQIAVYGSRGQQTIPRAEMRAFDNFLVHLITNDITLQVFVKW